MVGGRLVGGSVVDGFNKTQFIFVPPIINIRASILPCPLFHWNITFPSDLAKLKIKLYLSFEIRVNVIGS